MTEKSLNFTRRKFMAVSSAAIASPLVMKMTGMVPEAKGAEKKYNFVEKKSCDLVVLGGGTSGMVGGVRAAQLSGKKVIILEKTEETGGAARYATGVRVFGSKWQAEHNQEDNTIDYCRDAMDEVYWRLDEKLAINCIRGTGQFFDWLCEQGEGIADLFESSKMLGWSGVEINTEKAGKKMPLFIMDTMKEKCKTYGVEVLTNHPVVDVEVKNNKIVAAIAKSEKGYVRVACKACIMSIGSWINNEEILKKYAPKFIGMTKYATYSNHFHPSYTGDGIPLAEKVGAFLDYDSFVLRLMGPMNMGSASRTFMIMSRQSPYHITVNLDGKRYCCEPIQSRLGEFKGGDVQIYQPNGLGYTIFDENTIKAELKREESSKNGQGEMTMGRGGGPGGRGMGNLPDTMDEIHKDIEEGMAKDTKNFFKGDTLEELAEKIGVNKKNFLETVRIYNECCEKGADSAFFKEKDNLVPINKPPYYAAYGFLGTDGAFGGVLVNPEIQAYKAGGGLIEGLYVTGDFASGRHVNMGGVKHQIINDCTWAVSSGFLAGTNVSKYLKSL